MNRQPFPRRPGLYCSLAVLILTATWALPTTSLATGHNVPNQGTLDGWQVSLDGGQTYQSIKGIGAIEDQLDPAFDGVSIYRTELPAFELTATRRLMITFEGVATQARVFIGDKQVGEHLGAWTPFSMDVTDYLLAEEQARPVTLRVEVDEKLGHNTQGFLPIVTNHFGGIWKPVRWRICDSAIISNQAATIRLLPDRRHIKLQMPIYCQRETSWTLECAARKLQLFGSEPASDWQPLTVKHQTSKKPERSYVQSPSNDYTEVVLAAELEHPEEFERWSTTTPARYEFRIGLSGPDGQTTSILVDEWRPRLGFRDFSVDGDRFLLNGVPVNIRGLLNWGYAPPLVTPSLDESFMREELEFAQQRGFNMMKFCLWIPPRQYLELCDEMGILAWLEYPTWHPQLDQQHLKELRREYAEFYEYERNHCSIVLRSLTCETGPSAELQVIQSLYDQCKDFIPDAVLEDDSSWIQWNRVHDFYDDHPYGNNHTWLATLDRLKQYISERERKPLVLGEAIAADTWVPPDDKARQLSESAPQHGPMSITDAKRWLNQIAGVASRNERAFHPGLLQPQSRHYGMLMRKYQIEAYQREVPSGGYVVSVIRDFRKAHMGLIDYFGDAKHTPIDWSFQNDRMILLQTPNDHRSIESGAVNNWKLIVKNGSGLATDTSTLNVRWNWPDHIQDSQLDELVFNIPGLQAGQLAVNALDFRAPEVKAPVRVVVHCRWHVGEEEYQNEWPIWIIPEADRQLEMIVHSSAAELAGQLPIQQRVWSDANLAAQADTPVLTRRMNTDLLNQLQKGRKVVLIPDGQVGSLPLSNHWFLRGAPVALPAAHESWNVSFNLPRNGTTEQQNMLCELQHFDLAGDVIPNIDHYLDRIDPALLLWDNHDREVVNTHGLVFRMPVGKGTLLASALNHTGSAVGKWLFQELVDDLDVRSPAHQSMGKINFQRLNLEINRQQLNLTNSEWKFQPDPDVIGVEQKWQEPRMDDRSWSTIRVDRHWEGQGHDALDNWAWYRKRVTIPDDWNSEHAFLNFTGIDDYADIYVNGKKVGTAGSIELKQTAFDERLGFDISEFVKPGEPLVIAVAVYDWYGAGGIFRPVTLSTTPLSSDPPILK